MQITLSNYVEKMSDYKDNQQRWTCVEIRNLSAAQQQLPQYDLTLQLVKIKEQHIKYISKLASCSNSAVVGGHNNQTNLNDEDRDKQAKEHYYLALHGIKLLSHWTAIVMEVYSWKLVNPCDNRTNANCPKDAEDYERATR